MELRRWLGRLQLLDVLDQGADFRYRLHGTILVDMYGRDLTGRQLSSLGDAASVFQREYRACIRDRRPVAICNQPIPNKDHWSIDQLVLPLSGDGVLVDRLLVGVMPALTAENAGVFQRLPRTSAD